MTSSDRTHLIIDGEIRAGFSRYFRRERESEVSGETVEILKQKRMHSFRGGYSNEGRPRKLTMALSEREARAVRDLLDDWLQERENDE